MMDDDDPTMEATPEKPRSLSVEHLARQVWQEARSGMTPLDSERAVRSLTFALGELRDHFMAMVTNCEVELTKSLGQASHFKSVSKKLLQLVRGGYERCPVCDVADTQRHKEECWLRQLASPVWTRQTTADRRLAQAHAKRKEKGPCKSKGHSSVA